MNSEHVSRSGLQEQAIEGLIRMRVHVDRDIVQIDAQTWAIHGPIPVDGEVILAEFSNRSDAERALVRIVAAVDGFASA
jgi:hypothetical protein